MKYILICTLIFLSVLLGCDILTIYTEIEVTKQQALNALDVALEQLEKPYVLGGMGPDVFDCSGLILYSYSKVVPNFGILREGKKTSDANMMHLYEASTIVSLEEAIPGDIVFITKIEDTDHITHGGLFIELNDLGEVVFVNASSYLDKVVIDLWHPDDITREQMIVGFGRLNIAK